MEVDASQKAVGMALLQSNKNDHDHSKAHGVDKFKLDARVEDSENKPIPHDLMPVAYGSKTLTDAESQYANIERELLGVVAGVEKFHTFCYGDLPTYYLTTSHCQP